jgi:hypothetical protein
VHLGPLERDGEGPWVLGDPEAESGGHVRFLPEGAEPWWRGDRQPLVPWPRFMLFNGLEITATRFGSSRTVGVINDFTSGRGRVGMGGPRLSATLRTPYEYWHARISHHQRKYSSFQLPLLNELLRQTINANESARFGDAAWLTWVVKQLEPQRIPSRKRIKAAVTEARTLAQPGWSPN